MSAAAWQWQLQLCYQTSRRTGCCSGPSDRPRDESGHGQGACDDRRVRRATGSPFADPIVRRAKGACRGRPSSRTPVAGLRHAYRRFLHRTCQRPAPESAQRTPRSERQCAARPRVRLVGRRPRSPDRGLHDPASSQPNGCEGAAAIRRAAGCGNRIGGDDDGFRPAV